MRRALPIAIPFLLGVAIWVWMFRIDIRVSENPLMVYVVDRWFGTVQLCSQLDCKQIHPEPPQ
jgi:hypothetical protein